MVTYKLHFIRHGMTEGNRVGRYVGRMDLPVCREGREELEKMKARYEYPDVQEVYCSPLLRCLQTADILYPDRFVSVVQELKEYDFGLFDGKNPEELRDNEAFSKWAEEKMASTLPFGESNDEFTARCMKAINNVLKDMQDRSVTSAAVITHGGVILRLMCLYDIEKADPREYFCRSGEGFSVMITPQLWQRDGIFEVLCAIPETEEEKNFGIYNL